MPTSPTQFDVFISYRRHDSLQEARRLANALEKEPRLKGRVFFDQHRIEGGDNFKDRIQGALNQCKVMVVVIGPDWKKTSDGKEPFHADDWVRQEVEFALKRDGFKIFTFYVRDAKPLTHADLPQALFSLTEIQADRKINPLVASITKHLQALDQTQAELERQTQEALQIPSSSPVYRNPIFLAAVAVIVALLIGVIALLVQGNDDDGENPDQPTNEPALIGELPTPAELPITLQLEGINPESSRLVVAPRNGQPILWGYGFAEGQAALYAVDVATGTQITPLENDAALTYPLNPDGEGAFVPSLLHYDGRWLWVGSLQERRVVGLDASTMQPTLTWDNLDGQPIDMVHAGQNLWVLTDDTTNGLGLQAVTLSSDNTALNRKCQLEETGLQAPVALAPEAQAAIWVLYGRGTDGTLSRVSADTCEIKRSIALNHAPNDLVITDGYVWVIAGGELFRVQADGGTTLEPIVLDQADFRFVTATGNGKLLLTRLTNVLVYDIASGMIEQNLPVSSAQGVVQYGGQTWISSADGEILQYVIPRYTLANLVDILRVENTVWAIDAKGQLCQFDAVTGPCLALSLEGDPITMAYHDANSLWVTTNAKKIWQVNLADGVATERYTLEQVAQTMVEDPDEQRLWVANRFGLLAFISLTDGSLTNVQLQAAERPPDRMAYGGLSLWFAYNESDGSFSRVVSVVYDSTGNQLNKTAEVAFDAVETRDLAVDSNRVYVATPGLVYVFERSNPSNWQALGAGKNLRLISGDGKGLWASNPTSGMIYELALPD